jgi:ribosomal protein L29
MTTLRNVLNQKPGRNSDLRKLSDEELLNEHEEAKMQLWRLNDLILKPENKNNNSLARKHAKYVDKVGKLELELSDRNCKDWVSIHGTYR